MSSSGGFSVSYIRYQPELKAIETYSRRRLDPSSIKPQTETLQGEIRHASALDFGDSIRLTQVVRGTDTGGRALRIDNCATEVVSESCKSSAPYGVEVSALRFRDLDSQASLGIELERLEDGSGRLLVTNRGDQGQAQFALSVGDVSSVAEAYFAPEAFGPSHQREVAILKFGSETRIELGSREPGWILSDGTLARA